MGTQEGQILGGKYRVDRVLGLGEMGTVVAAQDLTLDSPVAIKILRPSLLADDDAVACFIHEARAAIRMSSPHVARVFDVGTLPTGAPYMVTEFLAGTDLGTLLRQRGSFAPDVAVDFILQASEAIAEAHSFGIVHRDLKPTNLFRIERADGRPFIKVLDFGIAKAIAVAMGASRALARGATHPHSKGSLALAGTPFYLSPEQIEAPETVDARTDVWALGAVLFELLTGKRPVAGHNLADIAVAIAASPSRAVHRPVAGVPERLMAVIRSCLTKDREHRIPNVVQLAWALQPFGTPRARASAERIADTLQVTGSPVVELALSSSLGRLESSPSAQDAITEGPIGIPGLSPLSRSRRKKRTAAVVTALAGVGLLAFAYAAVGYRPSDDAAESPSSPVPTTSSSPRSLLRSSPSSSSSSLAAPARDPSRAVNPAALVVPASTAGEIPTRARPLPDSDAVTEASPVRPATSGSLGGPAAGRSPRMGRLVVVPRRPTPALEKATPAVPVDVAPKAEPKPERKPAKKLEQKPDCNPSFELDDQGRKHFKPECFLDPRP